MKIKHFFAINAIDIRGKSMDKCEEKSFVIFSVIFTRVENEERGEKSGKKEVGDGRKRRGEGKKGGKGW